jgi:hypothetical protein
MLRSAFILVFFVFHCLGAFAQNNGGTISGKITDSLQRPLEGATILLATGVKDVPVKSALTDDKGIFVLEKIKPGTYKLIVSMTGFDRYRDTAVTISEEQKTIDAGNIKLVKLSAILKDVTITAQRPPVERKIDRTVVNADAMISAAGSTALDVLERSPGVSVDNNGVISLKGKNGVTIFVDDKPTYLSGADLENYLRSLPASSVDQIELMTNPPAKYDAAGGGGVINIRLKRTKLKGF